MANGRRTSPSPALAAVQRRCRQTLAMLPERLRLLPVADFQPFSVEVSAGLSDLLDQIGHEGH